MTLQSESRSEPLALGRGCSGLFGAHTRGVTSLEFESIDLFDKKVQVELDRSGTGPLSAFKEEINALRSQLRSQTEQAAQREAEYSCEITSARHAWEVILEARIRQEREALLNAVHKFSGDRNRYFAEVEGELVKLALAIAARILHREATMDPMLLRGVVRVALDQIADDNATMLRVPPDEVEGWQAIGSAERGGFPCVLADERLAPGECVLETSLGKAELGIAAQLREIERGFFDLLQTRPA